MLHLSFDIQYFSQQINENGFTIFITGILFTLSLYHFLLFFQHKDKAYLYYALYTFLVFLHSYYRAKFFFIADFMEPITPFIVFHHASLKWLYATVYLLFAISFIDLYQYPFPWNNYIKKTIRISIFFMVITFIATWITNNKNLSEIAFNYFFFPVMLVLSLIVLTLLFKTKSRVKHYLIIGFSVFFIGSLTTQAFSFLGYDYRIVFYTGLVIEATLFALGLGAKQKQLMIEKNEIQEQVIEQQKQNLFLQKKIEEELDSEIQKQTLKLLELSQKKEEEHKRKLAVKYSKKALNLRLKALQTQMNPHFLFNSLNSVKHFIIKNRKEDATFFLSKLSYLLRKILDNSRLKEISLKEELSIMKLYLEVENIRLKKEIQFSLTVEPDIDTNLYKIPPMVLQPFIENAIWHGLALKEGNKEIAIKVQKSNQYLQICIKDNGIGRMRADAIKRARVIKKKSLGIALTKQRLEAYTEQLKHEVMIFFEDIVDESNNAIGTKVHIHIPIFSPDNRQEISTVLPINKK